ncbi:MAG: hypothetical protein ACKVJ2_06010 [Pseudomonadales bacterium]
MSSGTISASIYLDIDNPTYSLDHTSTDQLNLLETNELELTEDALLEQVAQPKLLAQKLREYSSLVSVVCVTAIDN